MKSCEKILLAIARLRDTNPDVILFPQNALTGGQCGDLLKNRYLVSQCETAIEHILEQTKKLPCYIVIGSTLYKDAKPVNATYLLFQGEVLTILTNADSDFTFAIGDGKLGIYHQSIGKIVLNAHFIAQVGCDVLLAPTYTTATALSIVDDFSGIGAVSRSTATAFVVANGGIGDTSFPRISKGYSAIFECGQQAAFSCSLYEECIEVYDLDLDIIRANKAAYDLPVNGYPPNFFKQPNEQTTIMRDFSENPYIPTLLEDEYLDDLFSLQVASLARRMANISVSHVVIGVSGGLDSTLALLVSAAAMDALNLPRKNIHAVTMQGLGTSDKTYNNAIVLMNQLGCTVSDIPIKAAVLSHFGDIGHTGVHDVAYENAQARERTQILLDIANMDGAIVIGTGDLSEAALGFCTFGGDHMASFNVNIAIGKTLIRALVSRLIATDFRQTADVLADILATGISPELLPTTDDGEISQLTERILGEYELHDFFLYYFVKYSLPPQKILAYAVCAFPEKYTAEYIKSKLDIFLGRITASQFKRSCSVDSTIITDVSLQNYTIPSDLGNVGIF